jgi:transposase
VTHEDWLLFDEDECWFSRFAQPTAHAWAAHKQPLRLVQREPERAEEQKAVACFGGLRQGTNQVYLDFCEGQPNSEQAWAFAQRLLDTARQEEKRVMVIIWDHASWHKSKRLKGWIHAYNRQAKLEGDVRLLTFLLPKKSPWLNPIEPRWVHAKRQVCEPDGTLTPDELKQRLCGYFQTEPLSATAFNPCGLM